MIVDHISKLKNITLVTQTDSESKYFHMVLGDERRYLQILVNFLSNALKFSFKDSKIVVSLKLNECVEQKLKTTNPAQKINSIFKHSASQFQSC